MSGALSIRGLSLGYGRNDVVSHLDMDVPSGSIVALIGSNGAGKSTILRGISGLLRARTGSIVFASAELTRVAGYGIARLGIRHVPEGRQVFGTMTVSDNLAAGAIGCRRVDEARMLEQVLIRFPRLKERLGQRAGLMSGGEQQMLAMGRALMSDPKMLLLDEPSMGLAPMVVSDIFKVIADLRDEGRTVLLVEQNAWAALKIADFAYVLETGRIAIHGKARDLAANSRIAAAYLGG